MSRPQITTFWALEWDKTQLIHTLITGTVQNKKKNEFHIKAGDIVEYLCEFPARP